MNELEGPFWRLAPPVAAVLLAGLFVSLGMWQLDRADEKIAAQKLFDEVAVYSLLADDMPVESFQRVKANGHFISDRQFLIDNMISNGRLGYFVITAFEYAQDRPLLIVNRGWVATTGDRAVLPDVSLSGDRTEVRGRVGHLPRVGIRPGDALVKSDNWPILATYPDLADLAQALDRELLPFVLLLDPDDDGLLVRDWQPPQKGPMMHYGYAFQWFAMAAAVLGILFWQTRKKHRHGES